MSVVVEEFRDKATRDERLRELRERGHRPDLTTEQMPIAWEMRYRLTYSPQMRKRVKKHK